jgi:hypothetical protein
MNQAAPQEGGYDPFNGDEPFSGGAFSGGFGNPRF